MKRLTLLAAWELEGGNPGAPIEGATALEVFRGVPEGAVVNRVNRHGGVIAPAAEVAQLRAGPGLYDRFGLHRA